MEVPPKSPPQEVRAIGLGSVQFTGYAPTVWQSANFASAWFADAANEANAAGTAARRREILFAVAAAEAFLYEWTRALVLGPTIASVELYFPAADRRSIRERWKEVPRQLMAERVIKGAPDLGDQRWADFVTLIEYRNGLVHARASRPMTWGLPESSLPVPPLDVLASRLMRASGEFPWMPKAPADTGRALRMWCDVGATRVHWHYHFSVYGKFEAAKAAQLGAIGQMMSSGRMEALARPL